MGDGDSKRDVIHDSTINLRISDSTKDKLFSLAYKKDKTFSDVCREALLDYIQKEEGKNDKRKQP